MYLTNVKIQNIRSIKDLELKFKEPAGWHVIIGDNGSGKSTVVRSIALGIIGPFDSKALRINLNDWISKQYKTGSYISIKGQRSEFDKTSSSTTSNEFAAKILFKERGRDEYSLESVDTPKKDIWSNESGWFSCAFGPFRRFSGGREWSKIYYSEPRASAHLSIFGEDVALTEALDWLKELHIKSLEANSGIKHKNSNESVSPEFILKNLKTFLEIGSLLPHGTKIHQITSEGVFLKDGNGVVVDVTQMSDGYRSILSLIFELIRQLIRCYGADLVFRDFNKENPSIHLPGVVIIDEIDAHLHPTWQAKIGEWFLSVFPKVQFIVTTHSPLICRAAENGSIWRLKAPGTDTVSGEVKGIEKERLLYGDLLDAYGTELFGRNVTQSKSGIEINEKLAELSLKSFKGNLDTEEKAVFNKLKSITSHISDATFK